MLTDVAARRAEFQELAQFIADLDTSSVPSGCRVKKTVLDVALILSETGTTEGYADWSRSFQLPSKFRDGTGIAIVLYVYGSREYYERISDFFWTFCLDRVMGASFPTYLFYSGTNGGADLDDENAVDPRFIVKFDKDEIHYHLIVETEKEKNEILGRVNQELIAV